MRERDIDRSGPVWEYRPECHKTEHANDADDEARERVVFPGPLAQFIPNGVLDAIEVTRHGHVMKKISWDRRPKFWR